MIELLVSFSQWRAEAQERSLDFDCTNCIESERYKKRICFFKNKTMTVDFPVLDENGEIIEYENRKITKEDVIDYLIQVHKHLPGMLANEVLNTPNMRIEGKPICPVGLFDYETDFLTSLESAASEYHVLPYDGAYLDQPLYIIEAFDICRATRAKYSNKKMNAMREKAKTKKGKNRM